MGKRNNQRDTNGSAGPNGGANGRGAFVAGKPPGPNGAVHPSSSDAPSAAAKNEEEKEIPPGKQALPDDPAEFVEEIHRKVDLTEVWRSLLQNGDEKIRQRAAEKLTEMRYKGAVSFADEPSPVVIDIDSAVARRAAEGAQQ